MNEKSIPTFIINLKSRQDRYLQITENLKEYPIFDIYRIDAIHGKSLNYKNTDIQFTGLSRYFSTPSMVGCFLSHKKVWQKIVDDNLDYALVLEDDCQFVNDFDQKVIGILDELNKKKINWDLVYLGYFNLNDKEKYMTFTILKELTKVFLLLNGATLLKNYYYNLEKVHTYDYPLGAHCYLITNSTARYLLKALEKVNFHVDIEILKHHNKLITLVSKEILAKQASDTANSDMCESPFPKILNYQIKEIRCNNNISLSYYLTAPMAQLGGFHLNIWLVLFIISIVVLSRYNHKLGLLVLGFYFLFESILSYSNVSVLLLFITLFFFLKKN
jgi:GR25 family glycosyltransferase involved in LPS biosynthesis